MAEVVGTGRQRGPRQDELPPDDYMDGDDLDIISPAEPWKSSMGCRSCAAGHSQLAPVVAGIGTGVRIAYVQLAGGALPVALSDTVRLLKTRQLLETSVAVAPCFDGDVQALSTASALAWAKAKGFDVVVCGIGPGIVGSGSALGHGGLAVSDAANATAALGGRAIVVVRYSGRDPRERHGGVSHHTRSALRLILGDREVVWPPGLPRTPRSAMWSRSMSAAGARCARTCP